MIHVTHLSLNNVNSVPKIISKGMVLDVVFRVSDGGKGEGNFPAVGFPSFLSRYVVFDFYIACFIFEQEMDSLFESSPPYPSYSKLNSYSLNFYVLSPSFNVFQLSRLSSLPLSFLPTFHLCPLLSLCLSLTPSLFLLLQKINAPSMVICLVWKGGGGKAPMKHSPPLLFSKLFHHLSLFLNSLSSAHLTLFSSIPYSNNLSHLLFAPSPDYVNCKVCQQGKVKEKS